MEPDKLKAWILSVSMGLGHQRAAYPLKFLAEDGIMLVGDAGTSSPDEMKLWRQLTGGYEFLSRVKKVPVIGKLLFGILDKILYIPPLYPFRDLSKPSFQIKFIYNLIRKGLGKTLLERIKTKPIPVISTYPLSGFFVDGTGHPKNYLIVTDAEINRAWVPMFPDNSKIIYLAPCGRAVLRLREYGVRDERILLTGFPIPKILLGTESLEVLKSDLGQRLFYLDPEERFRPFHEVNVEHFLGKENTVFRKERVFTVMYAVGGAGALPDVGIRAIKSLKSFIERGEVRFRLVAGINEHVKKYFDESLKEMKLSELVSVTYARTAPEYFDLFTPLMRDTDVLWTKPSELSFYAGLGLPVVMTEPIGPQEDYNKKWLLEIQAGIPQENPDYAHGWLMDLWRFGRLAEAAWDGFLKGRKFGTFKIEEILRTGYMEREKSPLRR